MKYKYAFVVLCLTLLGCTLLDARKPHPQKAPRKPRVTCEANICIKTHGRSGRFSISQAGRKESHPQTLTVMFSAIRERDDLGHIIGSKGPRKGKHSFLPSNFAALEFSFSKIENTTYKGVKAIKFNFSATIPGPGAVLNVPMYIFTENGTLDVCGEEEVSVTPGALKYNIELHHWHFCKDFECTPKGVLKKHFGAFLDVVITVKKKGRAYRGRKRWQRRKGKGKRKGKKWPKGRKLAKTQKFFFGRSSIAFSSHFESDGNCTVMPNGFPSLRTKKRGLEYSVTFRFPKFNNYVKYDPVLELVDAEAEAEANSSANATAATPETVTPPTTDGPTPTIPTKPEPATKKSEVTPDGSKESAPLGSNSTAISPDCNSSPNSIVSFKSIAIALIVVLWFN